MVRTWPSRDGRPEAKTQAAITATTGDVMAIEAHPAQMLKGNKDNPTIPPQRKSRGNELMLTCQTKGQKRSQKGQRRDRFQIMNSAR
jgi:hypothetical protein